MAAPDVTSTKKTVVVVEGIDNVCVVIRNWLDMVAEDE
jgi:hypothetical protein